MANEMSRRSFLKKGSAAAIGLSVAPNVILGKGFGAAPAPSTDKLNILGVGIGGRGSAVLRGLESENIIGLCDVDWKYADHVFQRYPGAKKYNDYRRMFDDMLDQADAVVVATADHTHAVIAAQAIAAGKHVYVEKPLTHTVYESRLLTKLAAKHKVATQMGNQGASGEGVRKVCEWIWNGEIGEVRKVEAFTDRPIWPQGLARPEKEDRVPKTLNWESFIGPAPSTLLLNESAPNAQMIKFVFPARDNLPKVAMPEVEVTWYDGGLKPNRPAGLPDGKDLNMEGGGVIFYGTKDTLICGCYGVNPYLLSGRNPEVPHVLREITLSHQMDWVRACKEDPEYRVPSASDFSEAGPFNEMVVMGVLAVRLQGLNQELHWDGPNMRFTNIPEGATIRTVIKDGFHINDGHPTFDKTWTEPVDANQFAQELIRHTYQNGYSLPEMPE